MGPLGLFLIGYAASNIHRANVESGVRAALSKQEEEEIGRNYNKFLKEHPELEKMYLEWGKAWWLAALSIVCTLFLPLVLIDFIGGWTVLLLLAGVFWCCIICHVSHDLHLTYNAEVTRLWNVYQGEY